MSWDLDEDLESQVVHLPGVVTSVMKAADKVGAKARANLMGVRFSTPHTRIDQSGAHQTHIEVDHWAVDSEVSLVGNDAVALEFGHYPSGHFDPDTYGTVTKSPAGQYILTRAAGMDVEIGAVAHDGHGISAGETKGRGRRRGKRTR
jgi:hypothetical protein